MRTKLHNSIEIFICHGAAMGKFLKWQVPVLNVYFVQQHLNEPFVGALPVALFARSAAVKLVPAAQAPLSGAV